MSLNLSLTQLLQVLPAQPLNVDAAAVEVLVSDVTTDSRTISPGQVFFALRGEKFDGHQFVAQAIAQGATVAIVSEIPPDAAGLPLLIVSDTLIAYQTLARWWRDQQPAKVVAVTGSVGKTTTKELISAVLATQGKVLKTQANYNNEIGVPKTLLELDASHDFAVVEMGMRGPGEIGLLAEIALPDVAVITNVGTAHIGRLGSEQAIANAKCELLEQMPSSGIAVLNHDNLRLTQTAQQVWHGHTLTYGLKGGDVQGSLIDLDTLEVDGLRFPLPLPGQHNALNFLAALTVAKALGIAWETLQQGIQVELPQGRARRYELPGDVVILDESYNAGLESMLAALQLLSETPGNRRIAVLGTMKELGDRSTDFHQQVGVAVQNHGLDRLLILADEAERAAMTRGAGSIPLEQCYSHAEVVQRLKEWVRAGDRILFKASRAVGLDKVVEQFRADYCTSVVEKC
jgi:UDP-N-acetylmuramoyl-tripeptide--D-alanyl-D-alanine ligase